MEPSLITYLVMCPVCFVAGVMNSSGGGGGLLTLPTLFLLGVPPHVAIATNKVQAVIGLLVANVRYFRHGLISIPYAIPSVICAIIGGIIGSNLSMMCSETILLYLMVIILPLVAVFIFRKDSFNMQREDHIDITPCALCFSGALGLVAGVYDGFYGPGSGTLLVVALYYLGKLSVRCASAQAKVINLFTNSAALVVFFLNGQVLVPLGLTMALFNALGSYLGSGLIIKSGAKFLKPLIALAFVIMVIKIIVDLLEYF